MLKSRLFHNTTGLPIYYLGATGRKNKLEFF